MAISKKLLDRLTIEEVALELRMSQGWVRHQIKRGKIPAIRLGHKFFITAGTVATLKTEGLQG